MNQSADSESDVRETCRVEVDLHSDKGDDTEMTDDLSIRNGNMTECSVANTDTPVSVSRTRPQSPQNDDEIEIHVVQDDCNNTTHANKLSDGHNLDAQADIVSDEEGPSKFSVSLKQGPHIIIFSFLLIPFAFVISLFFSFYIAILTWYNLHIYFSEEKSIWHKICLCPLLILMLPLTAMSSSLGIALFAAVIQISWLFESWYREICDLEKGFFGWFCDKIRLSQCAPYEIVYVDSSVQAGQTSPLSDSRLISDKESNSNTTSDETQAQTFV